MITAGTYTIWNPVRVTVQRDGGPTIFTPPEQDHVRIWPEYRDAEIGGQEQFVQFLSGPHGWVHESDLETLLDASE